MMSVMIVDDDRELLEIYGKIFKMSGFDVVTCEDGESALKKIREGSVSVVVSDIIMPRMDGIELLKRIKTISPDTEVIMLTAEGSISGAVEAVKEGAFSYLIKPADIEELLSNIRKAAELPEIKKENKLLRDSISTLKTENEFIGVSKVARDLRELAAVVGPSDSSVLITGETGTGKEIIANMIHGCSNRADKPFVCVNCGALNENLIESELFGSEKGAYTGSEKTKRGRFEIADGGTIFFDEIGEMSLSMQTRLLRVLQEKSFERVGGTETIKSDFRIIAATNRDLKKEVEFNRFRKDLYYRVNIVPIEIPPLRDRIEDIPSLCESFLHYYSKEMNKEQISLSDDMIRMFQRYDWPGNVRELKNIVERLVVLSQDGEVNMRALPDEMKEMLEDEQPQDGLRAHMKEIEKEYIVKTMKQYGGNVAKAADALHIARKNLYKKLHEYGIDYKEYAL